MASATIKVVRNTIRQWRRRARERAELAHWAERDLRDAGLTRAQLQVELAKPFWRS